MYVAYFDLNVAVNDDGYMIAEIHYFSNFILYNHIFNN